MCVPLIHKDLITHRGDIHHIFPKKYLKENGLKRGDYNQIANYVYMQSEINIKIGKKSPKIYFTELEEQCESSRLNYGGIQDRDTLEKNLIENCIPTDIMNMQVNEYEDFLEKRRKLMSKKIRDYYFSL